MALAFAHARREEYDLLMWGDVPGVTEAPNARRLDRARGEAAKIDAAIDDGDTLCGLRVKFGNVIGRKSGIGDDHLAARHHRIVVQLDRGAAGIDAMECGHERHMRTAC